MSVLVTLLADALVAILLVASIVSSRRLAARIALMKADESAMRETIGNLVAATASAERAIGALRGALDECDAKLSGSLENGRRMAGTLTAQVSAGEGVLAQIGAIVSQARGSLAQGSLKSARERPLAAARAAPPAETAPDPLATLRPTRHPEPASAPEVEPVSRGARINATLAAAEALAARARARAA